MEMPVARCTGKRFPETCPRPQGSPRCWKPVRPIVSTAWCNGRTDGAVSHSRGTRQSARTPLAPAARGLDWWRMDPRAVSADQGPTCHKRWCVQGSATDGQRVSVGASQPQHAPAVTVRFRTLRPTRGGCETWMQRTEMAGVRRANLQAAAGRHAASIEHRCYCMPRVARRSQPTEFGNGDGSRDRTGNRDGIEIWSRKLTGPAHQTGRPAPASRCGQAGLSVWPHAGSSGAEAAERRGTMHDEPRHEQTHKNGITYDKCMQREEGVQSGSASRRRHSCNAGQRPNRAGTLYPARPRSLSALRCGRKRVDD